MWELIVIAVGLSMDAFAVSVCKGLSTKQATVGRAATVGAYFGGFQAGMPILGFFLGLGFRDYIEAFDHYIAFALLVLIGANMIRESFGKEESVNDSFGFAAMLPLAVSTSIDALAVGVTFAIEGTNIWLAAAVIGIITFTLSAAGLKIGNVFGTKYKATAERIGGIALIFIGVKILLEHLGVIG